MIFTHTTMASQRHFLDTVTENHVTTLSPGPFILLCELVMGNGCSDLAISASNWLKASLTQVTLIFILGNNCWFEKV